MTKDQQEAIRILKELDDLTFSFDGRQKMEGIRHRVIAALPQWIPVNERLPEEKQEVEVGCWQEVSWLKEKDQWKQGLGVLISTDDTDEFPEGFEWCAHGFSHAEITHWKEKRPPAPDTEIEDA